MPIIKNATDLSVDELDSFRALYTEYFRNHCIVSNVKFLPLHRLRMSLMAPKYAEEMIRRIYEGRNTGFVYFESNFELDTIKLEAKGFVVGEDTDSGMNKIHHLHMVSKSDDIMRKIMLREMLKEYLSFAKSHGMVAVQTESDQFDPTLNDDLMYLDFKEESMNGTGVNYVRSI